MHWLETRQGDMKLEQHTAETRTSKDLAVKKVTVLVNSRAGSVASREAIQDRIAAAFARHNVHAALEWIERRGLTTALAAAVARAGRGEIDAVVAGGGDGTVRAAAAALAGTDVRLGVLPLGTLNHFAKDLRIPLEIEAAAASIAEGHARRIDIAEVNGQVFINNSSIGIYPYLVIDRERRRRHGVHKRLAMVPAFFVMLRDFPRRRLHISAEGLERPYRTPCLFVGNNRYGTDFFSLGRRERLDTGRLWFYVVKPRSPLGFFWMICRMCFGRLNQARDLDTFELTATEVTASTGRLPVALDGEVKMLRTPLRYRIRPGALRVIVPKR